MPTNAFRADQIGSLLRPEPLLEARDRFLDGQLDAKRLEEMEDALHSVQWRSRRGSYTGRLNFYLRLAGL